MIASHLATTFAGSTDEMVSDGGSYMESLMVLSVAGLGASDATAAKMARFIARLTAMPPESLNAEATRKTREV